MLFLLFKSINIPSIHGIRTITHRVYAEGVRGDILPMEFSFNKSIWMMIKNQHTHQHSSFTDCVLLPTVNALHKSSDMFSFMALLFFSRQISNDAWFEFMENFTAAYHLLCYGICETIQSIGIFTKYHERKSTYVCWQMCAYAKCVKTTTKTAHRGVVHRSHCTQF